MKPSVLNTYPSDGSRTAGTAGTSCAAPRRRTVVRPQTLHVVLARQIVGVAAFLGLRSSSPSSAAGRFVPIAGVASAVLALALYQQLHTGLDQLRAGLQGEREPKIGNRLGNAFCGAVSHILTNRKDGRK